MGLLYLLQLWLLFAVFFFTPGEGFALRVVHLGFIVISSALVLVFSPRTLVSLAIITSLAVHIDASVIGVGRVGGHWVC